MYRLRFDNQNGNSMVMGHNWSNIIVEATGIDGITVDVSMSQSFDQIGKSVDAMSVGSRPIMISGKIVNFSSVDLKNIHNCFVPLSTVRMHYEDKYWIDCVVKSAPVFKYTGVLCKFSISLEAPYPYFKAKKSNYYNLNGLVGGFNFKVGNVYLNYDTPHNFASYSTVLFFNCINNGDTAVDYAAEFTANGASITNITMQNVGNQKYIKYIGTLEDGEKARIYRENGVLRVEKYSAGEWSNSFTSLDEDSNLFSVDVGDNVLQAEKESGEGRLSAIISFYDTLSGVYYGI